MSPFVVKMACWSHRAFEEQLGLCIPQEAISAEIHVSIEVKVLHWLVVVRRRGHKADTVLYKQR